MTTLDPASHYRDTGLLLISIISVLLAAALVLEFGFDLEPCPLCLTQRLFFMVTGVVALVGLCIARPGKIWPVATAVPAIMGMGFALRQLYLYLLPPDQIPACSAPISRLIEFAPFMELLTAMTMGTGNCAEAYFPLLGWNMPGYFIPAASLVGFALVLALVKRQYDAVKTAI